MTTPQVVLQKVAELTQLTAGIVAQAAGSLTAKAETLSLDELNHRLDGAMRALRGEENPSLGVVATARKTALEIAQEMVDSYSFYRETGESEFTVPAGVTDVEAMKALEQYFKKYHASLGRPMVHYPDLCWLSNMPEKFEKQYHERDFSEARHVMILVEVCDSEQEQVLTNRGDWKRSLRGEMLVLSDPRDQAIAAAIHACKHNGENPYPDSSVNCFIPGHVLCPATFEDGAFGGFYVGIDYYLPKPLSLSLYL